MDAPILGEVYTCGHLPGGYKVSEDCQAFEAK